MFDFHEKRKIRSIVYSKTVAGTLLALALLMSLSVYDRLVVAHDIKGRLEARKHELEVLQVRAEALEAKVQYLENERGIEEELRNRFDVAKAGEQVIVLVKGDEKKVVASTTPMNTKQGDGTSSVHSFFELLKFW
jgi:cell division protein FtsB